MFKKDSQKVQNQANEVQKVPNYGDIKIDEAKGYLEQIRRITNLAITQIKTDTDETENKRRIQEEKSRRERANQIQNEVITSHKKNVEIDWNWQELEEKEDCKELDQDIKKQIIECQKIIDDKNKLKEQFEEAIKAKDKHYVKAMQQMNNHIDELIKGMKIQFNQMRQDYANQLAAIESEFERERAGLLKQNEEEIKALFNQHQKTEEDFLKKKTEREEQNSQDLENQKSQDANNQAEQKIKLEKEMQILEKCMEDMKAVYRLNEEKLEFNTKVLTERASVNLKTSKTLKDRKGRYATIVRKVKEDYNKELSAFQRDNITATNSFKKFTKQFKELQKKFERFEKSDNTRLDEIWQMNEKEAKEIVEKIINCDKVIHAQQLDIKWDPPTDPIFKQISHQQGTPGDQTNIQGAESNIVGNASGGSTVIRTFGDSDQKKSKSEFDHEASQQTDQTADNTVKYERIKNVFKLLIDECEYLIDDRSFERCEHASAKEQFSIKIDSIRKSLGIENMDDVNLLVDTFCEFEAQYQKRLEAQWKKELEELEQQALEAGLSLQPIVQATGKAQEEANIEESQSKDPTKLNLNPDHIVMALELYHITREQNVVNQQLNGIPTKKKANFESEEQKADREKKKQKLYWEKMTTILTPTKLSMWKALDKSLSSYYEMLTKRQNLIEETGLLNQQNEELKTLLNQYLQAGVNQELQVPPTQVIRLDI